ncbi:MAG: A/G-specific adenine glycosylase, partial [Lachnospiraceae bacterium]|nr:A/G-specific adenine glycosylase [Lachnospiraceae bacterium]
MLEQIVQPLLDWFDQNARILPWREKPEPYRVWVSEIMLQQTRVEAVKPFFERFTEALPDIKALAECEQDRLLKLWEGLGYYNRVRNMQKAAQYMTRFYDGRMPADYEKLLALPGIGPYTAGAVASIAFEIPVPAVDGNVLRVITRITENDGDILKQSVKRLVETELLKIMPEGRSGAFNQALMELGAVVCVPNGPARCEACPVSEYCLAYRHGTVEELPIKAPKKERILQNR